MERIYLEEVGLTDELCEKFHKVLAIVPNKVCSGAGIFESGPVCRLVGGVCE